MYRIKEIEIKNFRAYQQEIIKIPAADIILLTGNNGLGKTSFFDAVEWGLTGSLKRYEPENQKKTPESFLTNKYGDKPGQVNFLLEDSKGGELRISRETLEVRGSDFNSGRLFVNNKPAVDLTDYLVFPHLLCQELVSAFIRNYEGGDPYNLLSNLLGLGKYNDYPDQFRKLRVICAKRLQELIGELQELKLKRDEYQLQLGSELLGETKLESTYRQLLARVENGEFSKKIVKLIPEHIHDLDPELVLKELNTSLMRLEWYCWQIDDKLSGIAVLQEMENECQAFLVQRGVLQQRIDQIKLDLLEKHSSELMSYPVLSNRLEGLVDRITRIKQVLESLKKVKIVKNEPITNIRSDSSKIEYAENYFLEDQCDWVEERQQKGMGLLSRRKELTSLIEQLQDLETNFLNLARTYFQQQGAEATERCPICQQRIETASLLVELEERLVEGDRQFAGVLYQKLQGIDQSLDRTRRELDYALELLKGEAERLTIKIKELDSYRVYLKDYNLEISEQLPVQLRQLKVERLYETDVRAFQFTLATDQMTITELSEDLSRLEKRIKEFQIKRKNLGLDLGVSLDDYCREYQKRRSELEISISEHIRVIHLLEDIKDHLKLSRARQELTRLTGEIHIIKGKSELLYGKINKLRVIEGEMPAIINDVIWDILKPYQQLADKIYHRINPRPLFTNSIWEQSSTIYSSGQINILALSIFLSFVMQNNWSQLDAVFLDDPIQSMDDINIFSFVDVLRGLLLNSEQPKQFFISTHDQKFYSFMKKKFRMFKLLTLNFTGYDRTGPVIEVE